MDENCLFCQMIEGTIPVQFRYQDDHCFVIQDIHPLAPTHLLIIPRTHMTDLNCSSMDNRQDLGHLLWICGEMANAEGIGDDGYRVTINKGHNSGQTISHLHLHLLAGRRLGPEA
ncbi:HIT domain-containing protein [SAR202 cluster bacterium AD-802-E10_MRT_200m]|nr:HIT domain-containing protein [SAR202 cluster bacterium AD-802-E10_MRT_200m]